jgi:hypothetical protein
MNSCDAVFMENTVRLSEPAKAEVREAFTALPAQGCVEAVCRWERRMDVLSALEESGAIAIRFEPTAVFDKVLVSGLKVLQGRCYDTGRRAVHLGGAAATLDDDRHLIVGNIRVCEKTAGRYMLWPYRGALSVMEASPDLLARLASDPVPFDCDTFDADSERLVSAVSGIRAGDGSYVAAVYPGPFRALVLSDGSVVRRGVASLVEACQIAQNGLLRLPSLLAHEAGPCENYASAFRERGADFILKPL